MMVLLEISQAEVVVTEKGTEKSIILELHVAPDDMGK